MPPLIHIPRRGIAFPFDRQRRFAKAAAGGVTRRKLVSTSEAAATGMHSAADIPGVTAELTIAFWLFMPSAQNFNSIWASETGSEQIYCGSSPGEEVFARYDLWATSPTEGIIPLNEWHHVTVNFGLNFSGTKDVEVFVDGVADGSASSATTTSDIETACRNTVLGDDPPTPGSNTDDGFIGHIFDFCYAEGIYTPAQMNYNAGNWKDLDTTPLANLIYRLDGQNASDAGEDSSGNGNHFVVENSGVTTSDTGLPPGANP